MHQEIDHRPASDFSDGPVNDWLEIEESEKTLPRVFGALGETSHALKMRPVIPETL